ncbi:MAG TPA: hypothetical protein VMW62_05010 [Chloroflexota bacterium]|nr:hypothetical protein [Chloroflexota bacterium]
MPAADEALGTDLSVAVPLVLVEAPTEGDALLALETPAEDLGEAAGDVRGVAVVDAAPLAPKFNEPTAN